MGRRFFDNLQMAMSYVFAVHIPIIGMTLLPVLLKWPLVLFPVHIVFLELIIDPACTLVYEAEKEEKDVMNRPPRDTRKALFGRRTLGLSLLQGGVVLIITFAVYWFAISRGLGEDEVRALTYATLILANLGLIMSNRSWTRTILATLTSKNSALWWVLSAAIVLLGLVLYVPFLKGLFGFNTLQPMELIICVIAALVSISWFEIFKLFRKNTK
jgi:Ca2+-transporting ATPase